MIIVSECGKCKEDSVSKLIGNNVDLGSVSTLVLRRRHFQDSLCAVESLEETEFQLGNICSRLIKSMQILLHHAFNGNILRYFLERIVLAKHSKKYNTHITTTYYYSATVHLL